MVRLIVGFLVLVVSGTVLADDCPGDEMLNGWCYPTGSDKLGSYFGWNATNSDFSGKHLAQDIDARENSNVYAIADGVVIASRTDVGYYGGADCQGNSTPGAGIIIRHYSDGGKFDALYAHMKNLTVKVGDGVRKGQKIGEIRNYTWCESRMDHLHFGIIYPAGGAKNPWAGYGTGETGFVDPIAFLNHHKPVMVLAVLGPLGWYPSWVPCEEAEKWYLVTEDNMSLAPILIRERNSSYPEYIEEGRKFCEEYQVNGSCVP